MLPAFLIKHVAGLRTSWSNCKKKNKKKKKNTNTKTNTSTNTSSDDADDNETMRRVKATGLCFPEAVTKTNEE